MSNFAIIRITKLTNKAAIISSGQHNFRERPTPNADPDKKGMNITEGAKTSKAVYDAVMKRIESVEVVDRKAVPCIEYFISASPEQFKSGKLVDMAEYEYFQDSLNWIKQKHGAENVVCSTIHQDEKTPHMCVYVVPIVQREASTRLRSVGAKGGGRELREFPVPGKSELSAKHFFGSREKLAEFQTAFAESVGKKYGLERGVHRGIGDERVTHTAIKAWYADMERQLKEIAALRANLESSGVELDQVKTAAIKERDLLARVRAGLDQREDKLNQREAGLVAKIMTEKVEPHNARIAAFKQEVAAFREEKKPFLGYPLAQIAEYAQEMKEKNIEPVVQAKSRKM